MSALEAYVSASGARADQDALVLRHADLVKRIAYHLAGRLPPSVDVDDLIQAGMLGLLEAASHYTTGRGASFETYAGIRIRGAMLDALRKLDWAPRSVHRKARDVAQAIRTIELETGREARDSDVAQRMGLSMTDYHRILQDAVSCQLASLDDALVGERGDPGHDPFMESADEGFRMALAAEVQQLPERERMVMALYYQEELNLKEIGEVLGVTESRVCQIHGQALTRVRARVQEVLEGNTAAST